MEFGHVSTTDQVDFRLPPTHSQTVRVLAAHGRPAYHLQPQVYIGCPTWSNKAWKGTYYPAGITEKDYLHWYSQQFNAIELNTTFYQVPPLLLVQRWQEQVGPDFVFCPKLPQKITREWHLPFAKTLSLQFYEALLSLQEHLGLSFLQLPYGFGPSELDSLINYLQALPQEWNLAMELRQPDWFAYPEKSEVIFEVLEALGMATVITDVAGRRDVLHQRLTSNCAFIRFNGYGLIPSDYTRIDAWVQRLAEWFAMGLQRLYFIVHQENIDHAPLLANYLIDKLNHTCGFNLPKCALIPQMVQGSLF